MIKKDIRIYRGSTFKMRIKVAEGVLPMDLTRARITSHIKWISWYNTTLAEFEVNRDKLSEGIIELILKPQASEHIVMKKDVEHAVYDVRCEIGGDVFYLMKGDVTFVCNVTNEVV